MAISGRLVAWTVVLLLSLCCVIGSYGMSEENSSVVSRDVGVADVGLVGRGEAPCGSHAEMRQEGYLKQRVASADGAISVGTGPCIRQTTKSCPVKCFRADPVCGIDKVTYWCGAADANCAGVEVAHDGYCNLWESNTNIGSSTAVQSLQLVHMLWLVVAGMFVVLGLL
ncbi:hypothetical protein M758_4G194500 [Ceratodon purpureus]|uniref:Kazal-like domain-containing protein n=1 Tax=Ceratodon purpureus TaxID=3225 RepID=A0A8T0IDW2_CERPU|nr:hypothetical protein KC19_4G191300 [Ceratodon purpureus]KAG0620164.1 hypothetical protein M758_4G194500 [Ceratodon purpureus]